MLGHSLNNSMTLADLPQVLSEAGKTLVVISYSTVWQGLFPTLRIAQLCPFFIIIWSILSWHLSSWHLPSFPWRSYLTDLSQWTCLHDLDVGYAHVPHARRTKSAKSGLRGDSKCLAAYSLELSAENIIIVNVRITSLVSSHELVLIRSFTRFYNAVWYLASLLRHM